MPQLDIARASGGACSNGASRTRAGTPLKALGGGLEFGDGPCGGLKNEGLGWRGFYAMAWLGTRRKPNSPGGKRDSDVSSVGSEKRPIGIRRT